jgi:hypothetical protein
VGKACLRKMHKIVRDGNLATGKEKNVGGGCLKE